MKALDLPFSFELRDMRSILICALGLILFGTLSSCTTSVKTDDGHGVSAGVHAR
jgi:hypothetical protein